MNGWVKLHRKILQNGHLNNDRTARNMFIDLLLIVDQNGIWSGGRFQLSDLCKIKPSNTYKTLKRLEKYKIVTLVSNNKYTTVSICNWSKYQFVSNSKSNNTVTTKGQHSNTLIRIDNKNNNRPAADLTGAGYQKAKQIRDKLSQNLKSL